LSSDQWFRRAIAVIFSGLLLVGLTPAAAGKTPQKRASTRAPQAKQVKSSSKATKGKTAKKKRSRRPRGQQGIDSARARQIQQALIRAKYLDGEPSGVWDQRTRDAMARYQADNGWQTKILPDARALIKLGLGPDHSNLINPETAATSPLAPNQSGGTHRQD
jgi:peptidoglycan hydrolase-like protein with peptidoglycan-binding domain